jgi:serine phosphatase RsbU (regulator of sigma subunit)
VLVLVSDGVLEAARAASTDLGAERLVARLRAQAGASASTLLAALQAAVEESLGGKRRADDHTFVVLRRRPRQ